MLFAWRAIDQAKDAKSTALGRQPTSDLSPATPGAGANTLIPSELPSGAGDVSRSPGEVPVLTEQTVYEPKYEKQPLVLKAACERPMYADLDEPRVKNDKAQADIELIVNCDTDLLNFGLMEKVEGSEEARPNMTPKECADKIRSALVGREAPIPVRKGSALCITTNYDAARASGDQWRMILMHVVGVANDGATTVEVSAWNIPD
ncbi:hypothetical protein ACH4OY_21895 [Micromonospora rubida]|uniref:Uncharacterized protein n=1 Tax=Micromonospora rubida TaxID=2697657 RepID=A0ABW7SNN3_9ACTN